MKIQFPSSFFQNNKLKEIYYKSFIIRNSHEKFKQEFQRQFPVIETMQEISLMNIKWGSSKKTITRLLGNPRFLQKAATERLEDIVFFKQYIEEEKAIIQCHFINDQFCYAHIDFVSSLSQDSKKVQGMVREQFGLAQPATNTSMIITDPASNKLILEHNVYLQLDYLPGKPSLVKKMNEMESSPRILKIINTV